MLKWQVNHDGTEYMLLEQGDSGTRQILAEARLNADDGVWYWSATRDNGVRVHGMKAGTPGRCLYAAEMFLWS